jgi:ribosomal protein L20
MRKKIRAGADRKQRRREFRLLGSFRIRRAGGESGIKERIFQRERPQRLP